MKDVNGLNEERKISED